MDSDDEALDEVWLEQPRLSLQYLNKLEGCIRKQRNPTGNRWTYGNSESRPCFRSTICECQLGESNQHFCSGRYWYYFTPNRFVSEESPMSNHHFLFCRETANGLAQTPS